MATITQDGATTAMVAAAEAWPCRVPLWRIRTQAPEDLGAPPERPAGEPWLIQDHHRRSR